MSERQHLLDFMKFAGIFGVIFVHFEWPGIFGSVLSMIGLVGVVLFFIISGYYSYDKDDEVSSRKYLKHFRKNGIQFLIAVITYIVVTTVCYLIKGTLADWIVRFRDPSVYLRMLILGDFDIINGSIFWFMSGLLYSYLVLALFRKLHIMKAAYVLMPFLAVLYVFTESYIATTGGDWHIYCFFPIRALPFVTLGDYIAYRRYKTPSKSSSTVLFGILAAISYILTVAAEALVPGGMKVTSVFRVLCATFAFLFALNYPNRKISKRIEFAGANYTTHIYLYHFIIGFVIIFFFMPDSQDTWTIWNILLPFIVFALSLILAAIICKVRSVLKKAK